MNQPSSVPRSILGADRAAAPVLARKGVLDSLPAPDLLEYWRRIMARKWTVMLVTVVIVAFGIILIQSMHPVYEATATVVIEDGRNDIVQIPTLYSGTSGNRDHFTTQSEFIGSRNVAERVIKQFGLMEHPEFDLRQAEPSILSRVLGMVTGLLSTKTDSGPPSQHDLMNAAVHAFSESLDVEPVRATQLVKVHFASRDPVLAADIANAIVEAYITADMDARYAVTRQAHAWLAEHVEELRRNVTASELALQSYRDSKGLIDKASAAQGGAARELEATMQRLVEARVRRSQAEQQYQQIRGRSIEVNASAPAVLASPSVGRAREVLADAERRMSDAALRFGVSHPQYQIAETELASARIGYQESIQVVIHGLAKELDTARAIEKALEQELDESRGNIRGLNRDELELAAYEQEVATNRQLYETFLGRLKETSIVSDIQNPIARSIDRAVPPSLPDRPAKMPLMMAFGTGGLVLGIALALFRHRLDDTLSSTEQLESLLSVPVVAVLPRIKGRESANLHRMFLEHPESGFSEAVRTARTALRLATMDVDEGSIVMVTSSLPREGKSTVALNLALAQAQVARTLLIECDIRRPTHASLLGFPRGTVGLTECVRGQVSIEDCVFPVPDSELSCMFAGRNRDRPLELLSSRKFARLLEELRSRYESIIIDTPPVALVSDAVAVAGRADGIVLVIRAHATSHRLVSQSIQRLSRVQTPIVGAVFSQLNVKRARKYYGEYSVYESSGYGGYGRSDGSDA